MGRKILHGYAANNDKLYIAWRSMVTYSSRCEQWQDFRVFKQWADDNNYNAFCDLRRVNTKDNFNPSNVYIDNRFSILINNTDKKIERWLRKEFKRIFKFIKQASYQAQTITIICSDDVDCDTVVWDIGRFKIRIIGATPEQLDKLKELEKLLVI